MWELTSFCTFLAEDSGSGLESKAASDLETSSDWEKMVSQQVRTLEVCQSCLRLERLIPSRPCYVRLQIEHQPATHEGVAAALQGLLGAWINQRIET